MKILYVEDDDKDFAFVKDWLHNKCHEVQRAETNSQAKELLSASLNCFEEDEDGIVDYSCLDNSIEYVILDLAIPFDSPSGDSDVAHGIDLAVHVRSQYPGMPILVLTGQSSEPATEALENDDTFAIFWDGQSKNLFKIRKKRRLDEALKLVDEAATLLDTLDQFMLDPEDDYCRKLSSIEQRIIKLFAMTSQDATVARVKRLSGGLSGAKVLRITLLNSMGVDVLSAVAKIDGFQSAKIETLNFDKYVKLLSVGSSPILLGEFFTGCANLCGVFFQLADNYSRTYFDVLATSDSDALTVLERLKQYESKWHTIYGPAKSMTVGDIRRTQITDEKFERDVKPKLGDFDIDNFEAQTAQVRWSVQHGDHHGGNVLVSGTNAPVVIDYGDIGECCCSLDPIVLLLSPYFHPDARENFDGTSDIIENWFADDLSDLLAVVSKPNATKFLREWAAENAYIKREVIAVTYAYCVRQIQYDGTDEDFAKGLIEKAIEVLV